MPPMHLITASLPANLPAKYDNFFDSGSYEYSFSSLSDKMCEIKVSFTIFLIRLFSTISIPTPDRYILLTLFLYCDTY